MKNLIYLFLIAFCFSSCVDENTKTVPEHLPDTYEDFSISKLSPDFESGTKLQFCSNVKRVNSLLARNKIALDIGKKSLNEAIEKGDEEKQNEILFGIVKNQEAIKTIKSVFPFFEKKVILKPDKSHKEKSLEILSVEIKK